MEWIWALRPTGTRHRIAEAWVMARAAAGTKSLEFRVASEVPEQGREPLLKRQGVAAAGSRFGLKPSRRLDPQ
jgi:hypothetical protein